MPPEVAPDAYTLPMSTMVRIQAQWLGYQGAPGFTNLYFLSDGDSAAAANAAGPRVRSFFDAIKGLINVDVTVDVQRAYQVLDSTNGNITSDGLLTTAPVTVAGTGTGSYAAPVGAAVSWETGLYNSLGHKIRGRTYLVPLNGIAMKNDGTLADATVTTIESAAAALIGSSPVMLVWTRPSTPTSTDGTARTIFAANIHPKAAVLRSRRD